MSEVIRDHHQPQEWISSPTGLTYLVTDGTGNSLVPYEPPRPVEKGAYVGIPAGLLHAFSGDVTVEVVQEWPADPDIF